MQRERIIDVLVWRGMSAFKGLPTEDVLVGERAQKCVKVVEVGRMWVLGLIVCMVPVYCTWIGRTRE